VQVVDLSHAGLSGHRPADRIRVTPWGRDSTAGT
jgi:hypothetical protein